ncbi:MAG: hypothetical protein R3E39_19395 [Anaerolineae bacterium]
MIQRDLLETFNDCVNRMAVGWTIEECLAEYPSLALQLRPMLEASSQVRQLRPAQAELVEDQEIVWERLMATDPFVMPVPTARNRRGYRVLGQLIAAVLAFILLVGATWFVLNRLILPQGPNLPILETLTPTGTLTMTPTMTGTPEPTQTYTPTVTPSATETMVSTATPTETVLPTQTVTSSATASVTPSLTHTGTVTPTPLPAETATRTPSACGAPLTAQDAVSKVLAIYPNTTIISVQEVIKFSDKLVWEVKTSHDITVNIDVACGVILTIERSNSAPTAIPDNGGADTNTNDNVSGGTGSSTNSGSSSNSNEDSNSNDNSDDSGGSGMGT